MQILMKSVGTALMIDGVPHAKFSGRTRDGRKMVVWVRACSTLDPELSARLAEEFAALELVESDPAVPPSGPFTDSTITLIEGDVLGGQITECEPLPAKGADLWEEEWLAKQMGERGIQRGMRAGEFPETPGEPPPSA
jgi:hypothetical protein